MRIKNQGKIITIIRLNLYILIFIFLIISNYSYAQKVSKQSTEEISVRSKFETGKIIVGGELPFHGNEYDVTLTLSDHTNVVTLKPDKLDPSQTQQTKNGKFQFVLKNVKHNLLYTMKALMIGPGRISYQHFFNPNFAFRDADYFQPGDSLNFKFITEKPFLNLKLIVSGRGASRIKCLQEVVKNIDALKPITSKTRLDSVRNLIVETVDSYTDVLSKDTRTLLKYNLLSGMLFTNVMYSVGKLDIKDSLVLSLIDITLDKSLNFSDPIFKYASWNHNTLRAANMKNDINNNHSSFTAYKTQPMTMKQYELLERFLPEGILKDKILAASISFSINSTGLIAETKNIVDRYMLRKSDIGLLFRNQIKALYLKQTSVLAKGAPAFSFALPDTTGKIWKMSDFKNEVVIIDFMYNTCPGCRIMMPYLTKVENHFKNNDKVRFIAISIDGKKDEWKKGIGKSSTINSLQLNTSGLKDNHPIIKHYEITSYPTLVVIGMDGKLIANRATKPSVDDGKSLITLVEAELKK